MIIRLFNLLSDALYASPLIALLGAFGWGVLSIILSPCHLASIPLIVGFIDEQGKMTVKRAFWISILFSSGILVTIGIIGLVTGLLGRMLGDTGYSANYFVALILLVIGLHLMEIIQLPFLAPSAQPGMKKRGPLAAFLIGLLFGMALGPCTFSYMAPMLGLVFTLAATNIVFAVALILAYALGHCSVIVVAGTFSEAVQRYLDWNERSKGAVILKKICGVLVIAGGFYMIFG